jgi:hypothetical protein
MGAELIKNERARQQLFVQNRKFFCSCQNESDSSQNKTAAEIKRRVDSQAAATREIIRAFGERPHAATGFRHGQARRRRTGTRSRKKAAIVGGLISMV